MRHSSNLLPRLRVVAGLLLLLSGLSATAQTPLPPLDSLPAEQLASLASQLFIQAKNVEAERAATARSREQERRTQEENLKLVRQDTSIQRAVLDSLVVHLKAARAAEREAAAQWKKAQKAASFCEKTAVMEPAEQRKNLPKAWKEVRSLKFEVESSDTARQPAVAEAGEQKKSLKDRLRKAKPEEKSAAAEPARPANTASAPPADTAQGAAPQIAQPRDRKTEAPAAQPKFAAYDPAQDVMLQPPAPPCSLAVSARDEFTGATLRQTVAGEIFRYTNPALRAYLEGKNQIVCSAALATAGPSASLWLTFQINDPNTRRAFGSLPKNSLATLTFSDGTALNLSNLRPDDGITDPDTRLVAYRAQYALDAAALRKIRSTELDRLRIAWSTGYEDYDVQQVDALMRQARCLE
jgi:hypothetical protein